MPMVQFLMGARAWSIETTDRQSLLELALSNAIPVNYSCKRGDCGQCVGHLRTGSAAAIDDHRPLLDSSGLYLCNAVPREDLVIELPHLPELDNIRVVRSPCKIHELTRLSGNVLQVKLRLPPTMQFVFLPGQYIRLTNKDRITRSYSLAASPAADALLCIQVRRIEGGAFSRHLFEVARLGELMHLEGPMGQFIIRNATVVRKTIFLATGTGIAPIHAMLSSLSSEQLQRCGELFLYWGNRQEEDAYLAGPVQDLVQRFGLNYFPVFSRRHGDDSRPVARHVQDLMAEHHPDLTQAQVFASGNAAMIVDGRERASLLRLPAAKFFSDAFTAS